MVSFGWTGKKAAFYFHNEPQNIYNISLSTCFFQFDICVYCFPGFFFSKQARLISTCFPAEIQLKRLISPLHLAHFQLKTHCEMHMNIQTSNFLSMHHDYIQSVIAFASSCCLSICLCCINVFISASSLLMGFLGG